MADTSGWAIDGPVKTPVEDARRVVYGTSSDGHGIASLDDLTVRPTTPTGGAVTVSPGSALVKSRYAAGQTYLASLNTATTLPITPTPSNVGRTDLIVFEVFDPWAPNSPHPVPANPQTFEYFRVHVIEGVATGTRATHLNRIPGYANRSGLILAKITIPAGRGDVQASMITHLAPLHTPKSKRQLLQAFPDGKFVDGLRIPNGPSAYGDWPLEPEDQPWVDVPEWAQYLRISAYVEGAWYAKGNSTANFIAGTRIALGGNYSQNGIITRRALDVGQRSGFAIIGQVPVPSALRGTSQRLRLQGVRTSPGDTGGLFVDYQSCISFDYEFSEEP